MSFRVNNCVSKEQLTVLSERRGCAIVCNTQKYALSNICGITVQIGSSGTLKPINFKHIGISYLDYSGTVRYYNLIRRIDISAALNRHIVNGTVYEIVLIPQMLGVIAREVQIPDSIHIDLTPLILHVETKLLFQTLSVEVRQHCDQGVYFVSQLWELGCRLSIIIHRV